MTTIRLVACIVAAFALALACTPAIIGISAAVGAASVGVTYEVTGDDCPCDGGKP